MSSKKFELDRPVKRDMFDYLPKYYAPMDDKAGKPGIVDNLLNQEAEELIHLNLQIKEVLKQLFIDYATWGLARWEAICGIPIDENKPEEQRRSVIKSKIRGAGTVTLEVIKNVADSFQNGEIKVVENFADYEVVITFIGKRGVPPNENDVRAALREIIPAHLNLKFQYTYLLWAELDIAQLTWDELDARNMTWDELEVWKP